MAIADIKDATGTMHYFWLAKTATPLFDFAGLSTQPGACSICHSTRRSVLASPG